MRDASKVSDLDLSPIKFDEREQVAMMTGLCVREMVGEPKGRLHDPQYHYTANEKRGGKEKFALQAENRKTAVCYWCDAGVGWTFHET